MFDALIGDPRRFHPVVGLGNLALLLERGTRAVFPPLLAGALTAVALPLISGGLVYIALSWSGELLVHWLHGLLPPPAIVSLNAALAALLVSFCIATRSLAEHTGRVLADLERGDLQAARESTAMIVGRDTASLAEPELVRATVECLAESIGDGITAPLAFAFAGGAISAVLLPSGLEPVPVTAAMAAGAVG